MVFLLIFIGLVIIIVGLIRAVFSFIKLIVSVCKKHFFNKKVSVVNNFDAGLDFDNPYIVAQLVREKNNLDYENYLKWLSQRGGDLPIEKMYFNEDKKFENELKKLLEK